MATLLGWRRCKRLKKIIKTRHDPLPYDNLGVTYILILYGHTSLICLIHFSCRDDVSAIGPRNLFYGIYVRSSTPPPPPPPPPYPFPVWRKPWSCSSPRSRDRKSDWKCFRFLANFSDGKESLMKQVYILIMISCFFWIGNGIESKYLKETDHHSTCRRDYA